MYLLHSDQRIVDDWLEWSEDSIMSPCHKDHDQLKQQTAALNTGAISILG